MKINLIVKLSIIFYTTAVMGADKEEIIKKVISHTKNQKKLLSHNRLLRHYIRSPKVNRLSHQMSVSIKCG